MELLGRGVMKLRASVDGKLASRRAKVSPEVWPVLVSDTLPCLPLIAASLCLETDLGPIRSVHHCNVKGQALRAASQVGTDHAQRSKPLTQFGVVTRVTVRLLPGPDTVNVLASRIARSSSLGLKIG